MTAAQLRIDQPLLVAEGLRRELFPEQDPALLAAVMAALVNEKETDEHLDSKRLPKQLTGCVKKINRGLRGFVKHMQARGFDTRQLFYRPALHMWAWASGRPWEKIIRAGQMAEGDLAMLVMRTSDHLRHISALQPIFPTMAATAKQSITIILRDPVIPDRQGPAAADHQPIQPEDEGEGVP